MNEKKFLVIISALTLIILFGGILFISKSTSTPQEAKVAISQNAKAETVEPTSYDWGSILMSKGNVTKSFTIKNKGTDSLQFSNIKTSCHCTKAHLTIEGKDSPDFGMSGVSEWVGDLAPGKEAKLTAIFDPAYHGPQGVGPITRFVSIETNDKGNPKITFTLTGIVVR